MPQMGATMRALQLFGDRDSRLVEVPPPPPPGPGEVQLRIRAVALNHIDVWGWRGMAFAKRKLPLTVGAEAVGEVVALGEGVTDRAVGQRVAPYGALTCGHCRACREGRDNLCENVSGVMGFHVDGFAQELVNLPARLTVPVPDGVAVEDAACAAITFSTVEHMLFDNARLEPGETILVQAGGSGIGTVAIKQAKALGCTVIATAGDDEKCAKARALGADHVVNYSTQNFPTVARRVTGKRGVDVVFEHVGAATWAGSLLSLRMGGRLVTCGSTSGVSAETNLMMIFQRQLRIFGSFGASMRNVADGLAKMAGGMTPVLDTVAPLEGFAEALARLESRRVFGKIVVTL
jgi:NADPH:quinone reductase-like Zn-dependent oxidoreductase